MPSFGLDLAGYSTKGSSLAMADSKDQGVVVSILDGHCFAESHDGNEAVKAIVDQEVECLCALMKRGAVYVDVPIDLQDLPGPANTRFVWEQTKRPIDRAFSGMSPLADRIGSYVARMQAILRRLESDPLGDKLFEAYPAATLKLSKLASEKYKGECQCIAGRWVGAAAEKEKKQTKNNTIAVNLNQLNWTADEGFRLTHDEFDAAVCALTGVVKPDAVLTGDSLEKAIAKKLGDTVRSMPPKGYALLSRLPKGVRVRRQKFSEVFS